MDELSREEPLFARQTHQRPRICRTPQHCICVDFSTLCSRLRPTTFQRTFFDGRLSRKRKTIASTTQRTKSMKTTSRDKDFGPTQRRGHTLKANIYRQQASTRKRIVRMSPHDIHNLFFELVNLLPRE